MVEKEANTFKVVQVTTQTAPAIETPEGEIESIEERIAALSNEVRAIKKAVA